MDSNNQLLVSPSPHIHSGDSVEKNMYGVVIALLPAFLASIFFFGFSAFLVTLISVLSCILFEFLIGRYLLKDKDLTILDGSAILTGLLLALNLPASLPWWIIVIGALVSIGIGKMVFGGLGNNIFNPAILGRVFLLISFPQQMTTWPSPVKWVEGGVDAISSATPLAIAKGIAKGKEGFSWDQLHALTDSILGQVPGSIGEVSAIALLIGFVYLLVRKIITWHIPVSILVTVFAFSGVFHLIQPEHYVNPLFHLLNGGMLLGAIFMATDYVTSPMTKTGQIIFGVSIALITMLIRFFGAYPEGMSFAILIMNAFTPMINRFTRPRLYGQGAKKRI